MVPCILKKKLNQHKKRKLSETTLSHKKSEQGKQRIQLIPIMVLITPEHSHAVWKSSKA